MLKSFRDPFLILLLVMAILVRVFEGNEAWVEQFYSSAFYPQWSSVLRFLFGWIPFSIGDVLYCIAGFWLIIKMIRLFRILKEKRLRSKLTPPFFVGYLKLVLLVYIIFSAFWGVNYFRQGIASQLQLNVQPYTTAELYSLAVLLQQKVNFFAGQVTAENRKHFQKSRTLFDTASACYKKAGDAYPFLQYRHQSIKPSFFSGVGHLFGFTGYYNPFSGEAQLNHTVPVFLRPFIVLHEIGHQLGYAKENEASFVAYLSCSNFNNADFAYSLYFELYRDATLQLQNRIDSAQLQLLNQRLHPQVKADNKELHDYLLRHRNFVEPFITKIYDRYLRLNNQPNGKATYSEVLVWLIAYLKKYGLQSL